MLDIDDESPAIDSGPASETADLGSDPTGRVDAVDPRSSTGSAWPIAAITVIVYLLTAGNSQKHFDYTFRAAENLLRGRIAFAEKPPSWLNEFIPTDAGYYTVFPLGAVLSMMPAALLKLVGLINDMPAALISAVVGGIIAFFLYEISEAYDLKPAKRWLAVLGIVFGTFMWTNLLLGGAWQLALGFAMVGELGAIYFVVFDRRPVLAGIFFALAFGNRTEIILTAPLLMYLITRDGDIKGNRPLFAKTSGNVPRHDETRRRSITSLIPNDRAVQHLAGFCAVPVVLGIATLGYNFVRFGSPLDFGYSRIPGVLQEPWYRHGIFSIWYIPTQAWEMLLKVWYYRPTPPYILPDAFSSSILISSPFLILAFRPGSVHRALKYVSWIAVAILTLLLWMHGNSGGWQFGYRYAMVLLPWLFVILLENSRRHITVLEGILYGLAFVANAYATWLFHWSKLI